MKHVLTISLCDFICNWISDDDSRVKVAGFDTDYINASYIDVRIAIKIYTQWDDRGTSKRIVKLSVNSYYLLFQTLL